MISHVDSCTSPQLNHILLNLWIGETMCVFSPKTFPLDLSSLFKKHVSCQIVLLNLIPPAPQKVLILSTETFISWVSADMKQQMWEMWCGSCWRGKGKQEAVKSSGSCCVSVNVYREKNKSDWWSHLTEQRGQTAAGPPLEANMSSSIWEAGQLIDGLLMRTCSRGLRDDSLHIVNM